MALCMPCCLHSWMQANTNNSCMSFQPKSANGSFCNLERGKASKLCGSPLSFFRKALCCVQDKCGRLLRPCSSIGYCGTTLVACADTRRWRRLATNKNSTCTCAPRTCQQHGYTTHLVRPTESLFLYLYNLRNQLDMRMSIDASLLSAFCNWDLGVYSVNFLVAWLFIAAKCTHPFPWTNT